MKAGFINLHPIYDIHNNPIIHPKYEEFKKSYIKISNYKPIEYNQFVILDYKKDKIISYLNKTIIKNSQDAQKLVTEFLENSKKSKFNFVYELFNLYKTLDEASKLNIDFIINNILDLKNLNNYYAPILINQTFGIFADFEIKNYIICRKTNDIYYELYNASTNIDDSTFRLFELHSNYTYHEISNTIQLNRLPPKNQIYDYLKITKLASERDLFNITIEEINSMKNYMLNYLSGLLSKVANLDIENIIKIFYVDIIKQKFHSLYIFLNEFIEFGGNKMIIYKNSLNILNIYLLSGKPIYFIKIFEMFDTIISRSYVQIKQFQVDEIANIKGSYKNIQKLITDLKSKSFTYNNIVIPNSLILGFITELNLIFKNDMDYILDYYNFCLIYDQQNILLKNKDQTLT